MTSNSSPLSARAVLESSTLFGVLTADEMDSLASESRLRRCSRGEPIWLSGADSNFIGLVGTGFVKLAQSSGHGVEMTMEIMGPGQVFGLLGTLSGTGCPLMAYGLTETEYLQIPKQAFLAVYAASSPLKDCLIRRTAIRLHQKLDFMGKLFSGKSEERIAAILFILSESYGVKDENSIRLSIPLTRQAIGEMAGTTTETTIRVLSKWARQNLVVTDQHFIVIVDPEGLATKLK